ncbi:integrase arm-type DNA-binding domain-containing protein [Pectobacterium versatile]|uniref:tyrosine-type recombinase/integrase n=1 Tax=Pectobacterium TaxID=122277 RepID=UPI001581C091|nr:integrase arm-type DNA-binding domain-containing protein [Pectobacterium polaris]
MSLTDTKVKKAKPLEKEYKLTDGLGMHLLVHPNGSKYWRLSYRFAQKQKLLALGVYPAISLTDARERRDEARKLIANGIDPGAKKKASIRDQPGTPDESRSFAVMARAWTETKTKWSEDYKVKVWRRIENYLLPDLGKRDVSELDTSDLLTPLRKVEKLGYLDIAMRLKQYTTSIMRYAVQQKLISYNPAYDLAGTVEKGETAHRPSIEIYEIPDLLQKIDDYHGRGLLTELAIRLTLLVFVRSSELRFARWHEIDFKKSLWVIPEQRKEVKGVKYSGRGAKMKRKHFVPLSRQAVEILKEVKQITYGEKAGDGFIFTGFYDSDSAMSSGTINKALQRMGYDTKTDLCGHGFRTLACSALTESGLWSEDTVELQMSHKEKNTVRSAYTHKVSHLDQRKLMLQWWADFLDANRNGVVSPFEFAQKG